MYVNPRIYWLFFNVFTCSCNNLVQFGQLPQEVLGNWVDLSEPVLGKPANSIMYIL